MPDTKNKHENNHENIESSESLNKLQEKIQERAKKASKENIKENAKEPSRPLDTDSPIPNQVNLTEDQLEQFQEQVKIAELNTIRDLLQAFVSTTGFNNGLDAFLGILFNQFTIPDIGLDRERLKINIESFLSCRVYSIYLETLYPEQRDTLKETEMRLQSYLLQQSIGLLNKDEKTKELQNRNKEESVASVVKQLQQDSFGLMRDYIKELKESKNSNDLMQSLLKDMTKLIHKKL